MRSLRVLLMSALIAAVSCAGEQEGGGDDPLFYPAEATLHRLTRPQIENSWRDLFGDATALPASLPADDMLYGLASISAARSAISPLDAEKYETATYQLLDQVWADASQRDALIGCAVASVSDPCVRAFASAFASRAWRRPVTDDEIAALLGLAGDVAKKLGDAPESVKYLAAAILLSPHFLFRVEIGERGSGAYRYTSWEMASRLSFLLLDAPPDDALRAAAASGELLGAEGVRKHAERLLDDLRARAALTRFFRDFMNIAVLDGLAKQPAMLPQLSATLGPSMRIEIERMFEASTFDREEDFRSLFTTRQTWLNFDLAPLYGVDSVSGQDFVAVTLPDDGRRAGLLTTAGFLALNAHTTQTSPTRRGRFIRQSLLCQEISPPPPEIDTTLPEPDPEAPATLRERLEEHRKSSECAGCHDLMDPIGFAFEHYNALGAYRDNDENGLPIDSSSELDGVHVEGATDMAALIASLPEVGACVARRFYEHAGGHLAGKGDKGSVDEVVAEFVAGDYRFKELVLALVVNDGYRYATAPAGKPEEQR